MDSENQELLQLINTAIVKTKEKEINSSYEERLAKACQASTIKALGLGIAHLGQEEKISQDQACMQIVEMIRSLDKIWADYIMMEGLDKIQKSLNGSSPPS